MAKHRNPVAASLKSPHLAPKRIRPRKGKGSYSRSARNVSGRLFLALAFG